MNSMHRLGQNIGSTVVKTLIINYSMEIILYSMSEDSLLYLQINGHCN